MRGDVVYRIYGVHERREKDVYFGARRTRAEAEEEIVKLSNRVMHGENWAARYHDKGFVIREQIVETDFEIPSRPTPREKYLVEATTTSAPDAWTSVHVTVYRRNDGARERICDYDRNYGLLNTFEPFRQGDRELALISPNYTKTACLDLRSGTILAEETESKPGAGFCPVGFYVPDWWDNHDGSIIPGSEYWNEDHEWPLGDFGFVWGCYWGDDTSWKVQFLDLRRVQEGVIARDDRFGYVSLATDRYVSPCFLESSEPQEHRASRPDFIAVSRYRGEMNVRFSVELSFDLTSGKVDEDALEGLRPPRSRE